jgi:xylose isomerase
MLAMTATSTPTADWDSDLRRLSTAAYDLAHAFARQGDAAALALDAAALDEALAELGNRIGGEPGGRAAEAAERCSTARRSLALVLAAARSSRRLRPFEPLPF